MFKYVFQKKRVKFHIFAVVLFFDFVFLAKAFSNLIIPKHAGTATEEKQKRWHASCIESTVYWNCSMPDEKLFPYVDEHIIVADKPSGMLSVPGREIKDSVALRAAVKFGHERIDLMVCHRLDMMTSGVLVLARSPVALQSLHAQFREKLVRKRYEALVHGIIPGSEGQIDLPIRLDVENRPRQVIDPLEGKASLTEWSVIGRSKDRTRVELVPITGRSHQLRIHMAAIGYPILGDNFYGTEASRSQSDRLMLHATSISFLHPQSQQPIQFRSTCPF